MAMIQKNDGGQILIEALLHVLYFELPDYPQQILKLQGQMDDAILPMLLRQIDTKLRLKYST